MLEGILHEGDEHQGRHLLAGQRVGHADLDRDAVGVAQFHQRDIVLQEGDLAVQRHAGLIALVEHEAHHPGEFQYGLLGLLGVDVDEGVDVVQRVHQEVGVDLVLQVLQLLLQVLLLEHLQALAVAALLEVEFHADVHAEHQDEDDDGDDVVLAEDHGRSLLAAPLHPVAGHGPGAVVVGAVLGDRVAMVLGDRVAVAGHGRRSVEVAAGLVGRQRGPAVVGHHLRARPAVHHLRARPVVALVDLEDDDDGQREREVARAALLVDQHRRHQVVVDEEDEEEGQELLPHQEDVCPLERLASEVRADGEAQQWSHEDQAPQCQVDDRLLPMFFLE